MRPVEWGNRAPGVGRINPPPTAPLFPLPNSLTHHQFQQQQR